MKVELMLTTSDHEDGDGNITGGAASSMGLEIDWQHGPIIDDERNGALVEDVLFAAEVRLISFQETRLSCRENAMAITKIQEAIHWLEARHKDRKTRGVHGINEP